MRWLGDFKEDGTVSFLWTTSGANGASITRGTNGTISVYKNGGLTQSVAGVTDTEDFDGLTGVHLCQVDLSADAFYAAGAEYDIVLSGAVIDGQTVNAPLAHFAVERPVSAALPAAVWSYVVEGSYTAVQYMRGFAAAMFGKANDMDTTNPKFRDQADSKNRISATADEHGGRSVVTLDLD